MDSHLELVFDRHCTGSVLQASQQQMTSLSGCLQRACSQPYASQCARAPAKLLCTHTCVIIHWLASSFPSGTAWQQPY